MKKKNIGVNFRLEFEDIEDINPSFALAKVRICYTGRNRNKSSLSREVLEEALPSLFYCPLVGRYDPELDDFGAHDIRVARDKDGNLEIQNATVPFGVVYSDVPPYWETVTEQDGTQKEYLCCFVVLWKRQHGFERLVQQDTWYQSMEIGVDSYVVDSDGYCVIEKMNFEALCILGTQSEPCFESASVQMKSSEAVSSYRTQFSAMIQEIRESEEFQAIKFNFNNLTKGGKDELFLTDDMRDSVLAELGYTLEQLTFEITEDMDEISFRAAIEAMAPAQSPAEAYDATYRQKREALENALDPIVTKDGDGVTISEIYFYVADFNSEYVFVERYQWSRDDNHNDYGRFKYSMTDSENGLAATIEGEFELMVLQWLTVEENERLEQSRNAFTALFADFEAYKKEYTTKDSDVEELRIFKQERLDADHRGAIDDVLLEFVDLELNTEFVELTKDGNAYKFESPEALRKECFAIRGKTAPVKFEKNNKKNSIRVPVGDGESVSKSRYGDLFDRF